MPAVAMRFASPLLGIAFASMTAEDKRLNQLGTARERGVDLPVESEIKPIRRVGVRANLALRAIDGA